MTLCTKALIQYVYEEYDIHRIEIRMSTKNKKKPSYTNKTWIHTRRDIEK